MFGKNTYLLPEVSPSLHSRAPIDLNGAEILLHHPGHHDMLAGNYLAACAPVVEAGNSAFFNQDFAGLNGDPSAMVNTRSRKQTMKRDRHSKICTSQGPRDRRVRLSIDIARKFFDLQEMLGFDKPSKTLDWLLTKSKAAIKELMQKKQNTSAGFKSVSSPSECEVDSSGNSTVGADSKGKSAMVNDNKQRGAKDLLQVSALNLAKESRVKARARARQRTREKMCIKQLNESRNTGYELNPSIPIQYMNNQLHEACRISSSSSSNSSSMDAGIREPMLHYCYPPTHYGGANESIVIRRKLKNPSSILGFQQNLLISRDLSPNGSIPSPYTASENWNISSFTSSQPNLRAVLDHQPKFSNI